MPAWKKTEVGSLVQVGPTALHLLPITPSYSEKILPGVLISELRLLRLASAFSSSLPSPSLMMFVSPRGQIFLLLLFFFLAALTILFKPPQSVLPFTDGAESSASL